MAAPGPRIDNAILQIFDSLFGGVKVSDFDGPLFVGILDRLGGAFGAKKVGAKNAGQIGGALE